MQIRKTLIAALALAIAVAFSPVPELQASSLVGPGSQPGSDNLTYTVKAKAKAKGKKGKRAKAKRGKRAKGKRGKRAASKRAGRCGVNMYYSRSKRSCQDARAKK
jgi:hypothetical protein